MRSWWKKLALVLVVFSAVVLSVTYVAYMFGVGVPARDARIGSGVMLTIEDGTKFCPSGGSPQLRLWDNTGGDLWDETSSLNVPIAPNAMRLDGSIINGTVFCRTGAGMFEGYVSPTLVASSVGLEAENIGARAYINGEEHPAFICWDTVAPHTNPTFHRIQFRADTASGSAGCYSGTR